MSEGGIYEDLWNRAIVEAGYYKRLSREWQEVALLAKKRVEELEAEIKEARNEAAEVRRAYLHECSLREAKRDEPRMTAAEHSTLLYLINSLEAAPDKAVDLFQLADKPSASRFYRSALDYLRDASSESELLIRCAHLRLSLK